MRKIISGVLLFMGSLLLVAGLVSVFWAKDAARKTPLEVDTTTYLSGEAQKLNPATGEVEDLAVNVRSVTESDTTVSDEDVVVFVNSTCAVVDDGDVPGCVDADDPDGRLVSASTDVFATDRRTALAVNDEDYLPADAVPHEGLINKFPFDAERKDYPYWDGMLDRAVTAEYTGTETLLGVETYVYTVSVRDEPAEVVEGVDGRYSTEKTIWVEPTTGSIVNQTQSEVRTLESGDLLLDLDIAFTDEQVEASVTEADDSAGSLRLISVIVPVVGIIGGLALIGLGLLLLVLGRGRGAAPAHESAPRTRQPV